MRNNKARTECGYARDRRVGVSALSPSFTAGRSIAQQTQDNRGGPIIERTRICYPLNTFLRPCGGLGGKGFSFYKFKLMKTGKIKNHFGFFVMFFEFVHEITHCTFIIFVNGFVISKTTPKLRRVQTNGADAFHPFLIVLHLFGENARFALNFQQSVRSPGPGF